MQVICLHDQVNKLSNSKSLDFELNKVLNRLHRCQQNFKAGRCNCANCWIPTDYGLGKTSFNELFIDEDKKKYYDSTCNRGVLGKFVPESYPENMDFLDYNLDFSEKNPRINRKFVPSISTANKTHYWDKLRLTNFFVSISVKDIGYGPSVAQRGGQFIVNGVLKDSVETKTADTSYIQRVLDAKSQPYAVLPIERSLYLNDPHFMSTYVLFEYLNSLKMYDISGLNIIPFVIGSTDEQFRLCCKVLKKWGFRNVAWSVSGLNKAHNSAKIKHTYSLISSYFEQVLMVNFLSFRSYFEKSVFVSPNWYLIPYCFGRRVHSKQGTICQCEFCRGRFDYRVTPQDLALCSLSKIFSNFDNSSQTKLEEWL